MAKTKTFSCQGKIKTKNETKLIEQYNENQQQFILLSIKKFYLCCVYENKKNSNKKYHLVRKSKQISLRFKKVGVCIFVLL